MGVFSLAIFAAVAAAAVAGADANAFLRAQSHAEQHVAANTVKELLFTELGEVTSASTSRSLKGLKEELSTMFTALPKNGLGRLEPSVVRYALHRYFVQTRGWFVEGLQPDSGSWNTSSPMEIVKDRVPSFIQSIFEERVHGRGLDLDDLAAFAATIQELVHKESTELLMEAYELQGFPLNEALDGAQMVKAVDTYLLSIILGQRVSTLEPSQVEAVLGNAHLAYPAWPDVTMWAHDLRLSEAFHHREKNPFEVETSTNFATASNFIEQISINFGSFQDHECREMKDILVEKEHQGSGRVRLSEFYRGSMDGLWQFSESVEYLRSIGALDESDPSMPSVVIPNYVTSHSNCLASSSFYSVCCLNECESLMGQIERGIANPSASAEHIANVVADLSSETVEAPRSLAPSLLSRLDEIAEHHEGHVPLHGRLFAQWMHHAFPRECPYPHHVGATNPMTPDEWMVAHGGNVIANISDMTKYVVAETYSWELDDDLAALPWSNVEELVGAGPSQVVAEQYSLRSAARAVAMVAAVGASLFVLGSKLSGIAPAGEKDFKLPRYMV